MQEKIKSVFWVCLSLGILAAAYGMFAYVNAYSQSVQPTSFRSFQVTGEAKAVGVPDVATFNLSILTEGDKDLSKSQTDNTNKSNKVIAFLKQQGVDPKDIQTEQYNVEPRYQYYNCATPVMMPIISQNSVNSASGSIGIKSKPCPPPEIVGYTVNQSVSVKVRDFSKIGAIMSGVVEQGANQVSSLSFVIDDPAKLQNEARSKAIAKAKEKAGEIAKAGGFGVGRLLDIQEGGYQPYANYYAPMAEKSLAGVQSAAAPVATIEPGSQDVNVTVTLKYEIK